MIYKEYILLEDKTDSAPLYPGLWFEDAVAKVVCEESSSLIEALNSVDALRKEGFYLVGFLSYEAGYLFQSLDYDLFSNQSAVPLLYFLAFKTCTRLTAAEVEIKLSDLSVGRDFSINNLRLNIDRDAYNAAFNTIQTHLRAGDTYQVNFTSSYQFNFEGSPLRFYQALRERQKVAYSGLMHFRNQYLLSLSPELFFSKKGSRMQTKPMKGTMSRSVDPKKDEEHKLFLKTDLKSIAENIMIVDLLRNDLSKISKPGSVSVPDLLAIESYKTVHQMVSTIESEVDSDITFLNIIRHLFPCGSITGAPKRRTMSIISELEHRTRGLYTGAFGYITPDNDMCFNVSIRTFHVCNGKGELGIGGGILIDSDPSVEFDEMQLKARFFTEMEGVSE